MDVGLLAHFEFYLLTVSVGLKICLKMIIPVVVIEHILVVVETILEQSEELLEGLGVVLPLT